MQHNNYFVLYTRGMLLLCVFNDGDKIGCSPVWGLIWNLASSICGSHVSLCNRNLWVPSNLENYLSPSKFLFLCETPTLLCTTYLGR